MTQQEAINNIFDVHTTERLDSKLNTCDQRHIVISQRDLNSMDPVWKDLFLNLLEEIPEQDTQYFVRARGVDGRFQS